MKKLLRSMDELARVSGLSRPTLSKYFSNRNGLKDSTRARIAAVLDQYDYKPNLIAATLGRQTSKIIGIVVPSVIDPFYAEVARQIDIRCMQAGYLPVVLLSHGDPVLERQALETLRSFRSAGVVLAALGSASDQHFLHEFSKSIPIVYLDAPMSDGDPFVGTDNFQSIGLIVRYLLSSGSPPLFLAMPAVNRNAVERQEAYLAAMTGAGCGGQVLCPPDGSDWNFEGVGYHVATEFLRRPHAEKKTILCANDRLAFGVLAAATERGIRVGRDAVLRVAGHDDHPLSRYSSPALTTVAQDYAQIGEMAIDSLWKLLAGEQHDRQRLSAELIIRSSA